MDNGWMGMDTKVFLRTDYSNQRMSVCESDQRVCYRMCVCVCVCACVCVLKESH